MPNPVKDQTDYFTLYVFKLKCGNLLKILTYCNGNTTEYLEVMQQCHPDKQFSIGLSLYNNKQPAGKKNCQTSCVSA